MAPNNLKRIFADVVSIDSWHTPFDGATGTASVHVDAFFGEARIGGQADAPVRFRLSLKRAEIVVVIPETEPLKVEKGSVSRDQNIVVTVNDRIETKTSAATNLQAGVKYPVIASVAASGGLGFSQERTHSVQTEQQLCMILATQNQTAEGFYRWECRPAIGKTLQGRPWDPSKDSRLKIKDIRRNSHHLQGALRIELRCRREDLYIEDIEIKDETLLDKLTGSARLRNKLIAVEAYLKHLLASEKLNFDNISDPYGQICLADVIVEESSS